MSPSDKIKPRKKPSKKPTKLPANAVKSTVSRPKKKRKVAKSKSKNKPKPRFETKGLDPYTGKFVKGNKLGRGKGRPKGSFCLKNLLIKELSKNKGKTGRKFIKRTVQHALNGNGQAIKVVFDRTDGLLRQTLEVEGTTILQLDFSQIENDNNKSESEN